MKKNIVQLFIKVFCTLQGKGQTTERNRTELFNVNYPEGVYAIFIVYSLPGNENAKKEGYGRGGSEYNRKVCLMDELIISRNRKYDGII